MRKDPNRSMTWIVVPAVEIRDARLFILRRHTIKTMKIPLKKLIHDLEMLMSFVSIGYKR